MTDKPEFKEINMDIIEKTKHDGAVKALKQRIDSLLTELENRNFDRIKSNGTFNRLGDAICDARNILSQIEATLIALQNMESENK